MKAKFFWKFNLKLIPILFCYFFSCQLIYAIDAEMPTSLKLPSLIGNHMVIQQQSTFTFWGWAKVGDTVLVNVGWDKKTKKCIADKSGEWKLKFSTPKAGGGPFKVVISADKKIVLNDVLIGEVWVCSGQSNMQMTFNGYMSQPVIGSNDYIAHGKNKNIRLFTLKQQYGTRPAQDCEGNWEVSNTSNVAEFSAIAYVFGDYLEDVLDVPVGLILSAKGDTPAEAWVDEATLKSEFKEIDLSVLKTNQLTYQSPTVLYNHMIHPILNYTIRGVIWSQGTNNRKNPEQYSKLFPALIRNWREKWKLGDFPFYFVQNAPYSFRHDANTQTAFLREAQLKTMLTTPRTGMAVAMDVGDSLYNHPPRKIEIGKRLAYWALAKTYNLKGISYSGPVLKDFKVIKNKMELEFNFAENGLSSFGKKLKNFVVAGENRHFYPANAVIKDDKLEVWSEDVKIPIAVRYCWDNYAEGCLFNNAGLPASSFRTDNWEE